MTNKYKLKFGELGELKSWMALVTLVRDNFPPLADNEKGISPRALYKKIGFKEDKLTRAS